MRERVAQCGGTVILESDYGEGTTVTVSVPIAECAGSIFWVGGFRVDDRFKVGKSEKEFLRIRLTKPEIKLIKDF